MGREFPETGGLGLRLCTFVPCTQVINGNKNLLLWLLLLYLTPYSQIVNRHNCFPQGAAAPSGSGPPVYGSFTITLRHTKVGRTPLDEWSARRRDLYVVTNITHKSQTSKTPSEIWTHNPNKRAAADPRPRQHGHQKTRTDITSVRTGTPFYGAKVTSVGPGSVAGIATTLRAEQFGIPTPVGGKKLDLFHTIPDRPCAPASSTVGIEVVYHGQGARYVILTTQFYLAPSKAYDTNISCKIRS